MEQEPVEENVAPKGPVARMSMRTTGVLLLTILIGGLAGGYLLGRALASGSARNPAAPPTVNPAVNVVSSPTAVPAQQPGLVEQINPSQGYTVPASFGDLGPQLLAAGAIDYERFVKLYADGGRPLTEEQLALLTQGSAKPVVINRDNAQFLLNFFWAVGLTNKNKVLEEGPMKTYSNGKIGGFASTGGWTIGAKPPEALYASTLMIELTTEQQARVEEVATGIYRPCCNNPTLFPDCNHGMAMLGLLELMASQNATVDQMFTAAKYVNAFWFPQQTLALAKYFQVRQGLDFAQVDARQILGKSFSSSAGFQAAYKWLADNNQLEQAPGGGGSCSVH